MKESNFFRLRSKMLSANAQFYAVGIDLEPDPTGTTVRKHTKLMKGLYEGIDFPVIFKQEEKGKITDVLETGWHGLFLISENMKKALEINGLTGWKVFPIKLFDLKGNEISGYHGFSITGHCGPVIDNKLEIVEKRIVPHGPLIKYYKGISFDRWDGSDFFIPDKSGYHFITKKAAEVLRKNKFSNLYLVNLADVETDARYVV